MRDSADNLTKRGAFGGGVENIARDVIKLVIGCGIKQIIAKKALYYSNSMIKTEIGIKRKSLGL